MRCEICCSSALVCCFEKIISSLVNFIILSFENNWMSTIFKLSVTHQKTFMIFIHGHLNMGVQFLHASTHLELGDFSTNKVFSSPF